MPSVVDIPDIGEVEFPDEMDDAAILVAIEGEIIPQHKRQVKGVSLRKQLAKEQASPRLVEKALYTLGTLAQGGTVQGVSEFPSLAIRAPYTIAKGIGLIPPDAELGESLIPEGAVESIQQSPLLSQTPLGLPGVAKTARTFATPENVAMLPLFGTSLAKPLVGGFAMTGVEAAPHTAEELGRLSVEGSPEERAEAGYMALMTGLMVGAPAMLRPPVSPEIPAVRGSSLSQIMPPGAQPTRRVFEMPYAEPTPKPVTVAPQPTLEVQRAIPIRETAAPVRDVPQPTAEVRPAVPAQEGAGGVPRSAPPVEGTRQAEVPLKADPADLARYQELDTKMQEMALRDVALMETDEFKALWDEANVIKNKYGGMPPADVGTRAPVAKPTVIPEAKLEPTVEAASGVPLTEAGKTGVANDRILAAAVQSSDGTIYTGKWHPAAYDKYSHARGITKEQTIAELKSGSLKDGFITESGAFVNRDEAAVIASKFKQFKPDKEGDIAFAGGLKGMKEGPGIVAPPPIPPAKPSEPAAAKPSKRADIADEAAIEEQATARQPPAEPVAAKTKAQLVDDILGPKPQPGLPSVQLRVQWEKQSKDLTKRTRDELETIAKDKAIAESRESEIAASTTKIIPEVEAIAKSAGARWRTALRSKADSEQVRFPTAQGMTRGDVVYYVARAIAERRRSAEPATKPAEPVAPTAEAVPKTRKREKKGQETVVAARETITPADDVVLGTNAAGETIRQRADGSVYRMRFDRKDKPNGYPDFGGDLNPRKRADVEDLDAIDAAAEAQQPSSLPSGPGAASPVEFSQRRDRAVSGRPPPNDAGPTAVVPGDQTPTPDVTRRVRDFQPINVINSPQFTYWFGKLGEAAKTAWERMALASFAIREKTGKDIELYVDGILSSVPRRYRRQGGKAFFDLLDGKTMPEIESALRSVEGAPEILAAANSLKTRLEEIRVTIRDTKRESYKAFLSGMKRADLEGLFRENISDAIDTTQYSRDDFAHALSRNQFPDDWGIADGSYMPHMFFGDFTVSVTPRGSDTPMFIGRAQTVAEAKARVYQASKDRPELADGSWEIKQSTVFPADVVRLGDRRFWKMISDMRERSGPDFDAREAVRGIIGRQAARQKWWGNLQKRVGFTGYEQSFRKSMSVYLTQFNRWRELNAAQKDVVPQIEHVRRQGRLEAAKDLENLWDYVWGKPAQSTLLVDNFIRELPVLRDYIRPMALDRFSTSVRSMVINLALLTPRFAILNRLQPMQGLLTLVGERALLDARKLRHSDSGKALLDEAGVRFDPGQYGDPRQSLVRRALSLRETLTGERANQEIAFLAMYQHAVNRGVPHGEAIKYAKLRGQLFTQFTPIAADVPPVMRGPIASTLFQFKRFPIKQVELLGKLAATKNVPGIARWLAVMAVMGGAQFFMRQFYVDNKKREQLRRAAVDAVGEYAADGLLYGLPGLLAHDFSGSLVLGDEPFGQNIYEKLSRAIAGPAITMAIETHRAAITENREPTSAAQDVEAMLRRFPSLRPLAELSALLRGDTDVRSPDGELKLRRSLAQTLVGMGGFRTTKESNQRIYADAFIELQAESRELKNRYFVQIMDENGDLDPVIADIESFNVRWPEFAISPESVIQYVGQRASRMSQTDFERLTGKRGMMVIPE